MLVLKLSQSRQLFTEGFLHFNTMTPGFYTSFKSVLQWEQDKIIIKLMAGNKGITANVQGLANCG